MRSEFSLPLSHPKLPSDPFTQRQTFLAAYESYLVRRPGSDVSGISSNCFDERS